VAKSEDRIEIYREAMDLSRFGSDSYRVALRHFLQAKYADKKIDVVVGVMRPALDFLLDYRGSKAIAGKHDRTIYHSFSRWCRRIIHPA